MSTSEPTPAPAVTDQELRELVDRQQIAEVLYRYASTVDYKDFATMRTLFTDDAHGEYAGVADLDGADAIVEWIDSMTADKSWQHHKLNVYHVDFVGPNEAKALTYHTSHQTDVGTTDSVVLIVSRYHDTLKRVDGTWKISEKIMEKGWTEPRSGGVAPVV